MKYDATLVQPVAHKLHLSWIGFRAPRGIVWHQPNVPTYREFLRKVSENFGEDFALTSLCATNPRKPYPLLRRSQFSLQRSVALKPKNISGFVVLFQDVERVAMMQLHADCP